MEKKYEEKVNNDSDQEIGRYTPRPSEPFFEPNQIDFEHWQNQLNQNFNQLAHQLEKMHADLAKALSDNLAFIKEKNTED